ncbi:MAG: hypothetical protein QM638_08075 [Nocardioides sp.]|uniref:hypothetical protein n=1 Tax=Nocardioides sp. TaxID=35761 RepID=UPI0039E2EF0A
MPAPTATFYRLARALRIRFLGLAVVALALVVMLTTVVVSAVGAGHGWILAVLVLGLVAVAAGHWWLRVKAYVVRCTAQGYSVRLVRGAGTREARWVDIAEAVTSWSHGTPCLVLRLRDGRSTTIPVSILAIDREEFVREMQRHFAASITPLEQ